MTDIQFKHLQKPESYDSSIKLVSLGQIQEAFGFGRVTALKYLRKHNVPMIWLSPKCRRFRLDDLQAMIADLTSKQVDYNAWLAKIGHMQAVGDQLTAAANMLNEREAGHG